ncbi:aspartic protein-like protein 2 [Dorcoceras hygrometricum]|uniref:Aspartic protein-like protein 2 n=1 Tax=Dorcoceras hygrometricum TaxID=472368 RepID=A0A2Z7D3N4_9LAMI|nr:aspartic protein-like protein 2 [Dorcoceras hygrometricum]
MRDSCEEGTWRSTVELTAGARLRPDSQGIWHFKLGGGRSPQSGPRLESGLLRQSALEDLTNVPRTESPRQGDRNKSDHTINGGGAWRRGGGREVMGGRGSGAS